MNEPTYQQQLTQEAEQWGNTAEEQAARVPPDWRYYRALRDNVIMHTADIDALLGNVHPGMTALELGCGPGWLALAMAQRGASARGIDISPKAIEIARGYYESIREEVSGSAAYEIADLNTIDLPADAYDIVAAKGTLHHLVQLDHVIDQVHRALKPGGLFWMCDTNGDEAASTVLIASALMFVLPTYVSYRDKLRGLLRFGVHAPGRIKASIQAQGLSPFEGVGREHDWLKLVQERFNVERLVNYPAFTGYITAQIALPDRLALPLLRLMHRADSRLVRWRILRNTGVVVYARKSASAP